MNNQEPQSRMQRYNFNTEDNDKRPNRKRPKKLHRIRQIIVSFLVILALIVASVFGSLIARPVSVTTTTQRKFQVVKMIHQKRTVTVHPTPIAPQAHRLVIHRITTTQQIQLVRAAPVRHQPQAATAQTLKHQNQMFRTAGKQVRQARRLRRNPRLHLILLLNHRHLHPKSHRKQHRLHQQTTMLHPTVSAHHTPSRPFLTPRRGLQQRSHHG